MEVADLYVRVSTDEQADKGYSQRNQEEVLRKYCINNGLQVRKVIYEDHSAKTFKRPEWQKFLSFLKKNKGRGTDKVLFTKWDRFSRNAGDAYQMINTLREMKVEPQAIEQPLDLSIPENKMMLAIYLAAPEVENDRRGLNIFYGMRRALKEGRYLRRAPVGYINRMEGSRKFIGPKEPDAGIVKWVFNSVAQNKYHTEQVWSMALKKGLKTSRANFHRMLRNPIYCGKIFVPAFKDEESMYVEGQHEPLISEYIFYKVQETLNANGRPTHTTKIKSRENLPLRGFLTCPKCEKVLTGSASRGRTKRYYYYHCNSKCGFRYKAPEANEMFIQELKKITIRRGRIEGFKVALKTFYNNQFKKGNENKKKIVEAIDKENQKLARARDLLLNGDIEGEDYKEIKAICNEKLNGLENRLSAILPDSRDYMTTFVDKAVDSLSNIDKLYKIRRGGDQKKNNWFDLSRKAHFFRKRLPNQQD